MKEFLYFDKETNNLSKVNRTLMFGEGVFETFRYKQSLPVFFSLHMERLKASCDAIKINFPGDFYIETIVEKFVKEHSTNHINNVIKDLMIKVILFSSGGASYGDKSENTIVCISIKEEDTQFSEGIKIKIADNIKFSNDIISKHKTTNYLLSSIEKKIALEFGFDDALFINENNIVSETTAGNFFWIKGSNVFTPSLQTGALDGITRRLILKVCRKNKIRLYEGEFEPGSIIFPEAMFITNSVRGIVEVLNLNNTTKPTRTNKLFPTIKKGLFDILNW